MPHFRCQFHQHFTHAFFVQKCLEQLFSSYILALAKIQKKLSKNALVKCWWNWRQGEPDFFAHWLNFGEKLHFLLFEERLCSHAFSRSLFFSKTFGWPINRCKLFENVKIINVKGICKRTFKTVLKGYEVFYDIAFEQQQRKIRNGSHFNGMRCHTQFAKKK